MILYDFPLYESSKGTSLIFSNYKGQCLKILHLNHKSCDANDKISSKKDYVYSMTRDTVKISTSSLHV